MTAATNIGALLEESARLYADRPALHRRAGRGYASVSFAGLDALSNRYANGLRKAGVAKGSKCLVMLRPGFDFIATVFAVFKMGAIPVLIDPGMGRKNLLKCVRDTAPEAMVAIPMVHWARLFFREAFASVKVAVGLRGSPPGVPTLEGFRRARLDERFTTEDAQPKDVAAILFTTGSTGPPKGVVYTHAIFLEQVRLIRDTYGVGPDSFDMPVFPLFALFSAALGMPCVIPDMDPSRPAQADPGKIVRTIQDHQVSFSFGSPALWSRVAAYCVERGVQLPSLKKVLMAGAPVPAKLHLDLKRIMAKDGETLVPYGATEALPIATFTGTEMLAETAALTARGKGVCVGYPLPGMTIKVIRSTPVAIDVWDDQLVLPRGEIGEIAVKGPVVTPEYHRAPLATSLAKIKDQDGSLWHRMGDMGYFDERGRLWFCGRKAHVVNTAEGPLYSVCCEAIFNAHPAVSRSALVGVSGSEPGVKIPALVVEPAPGMMPKTAVAKAAFADGLRQLGEGDPLTERIGVFLFHPAFPVDIRHNAKIFREQLAVWAESVLKARTRA